MSKLKVNTLENVTGTSLVEVEDINKATSVEFQQSGAGAVVRSASDKLREFVSVKDFGAVGDGVADDTAAIQAALAAHSAVFFPPGNYKISGSSSLNSGNVLLGAGYSNTRIFRDTGVAVFDYFSGITVTGVRVSGIHFDGVAKLPVTIAENRYCALRFWDNGTGNRSSDVVIEDCKFTYFTSAEYQPEGNRGVIAFSYCDNAVVRGCWFEDSRATCVFYGATKNLRVLDNYCIGEQAPFDLVFQPTQGFGSFCSGGSEGCIISNNRIRDTGYSSINCGGDGSVVSGNVIRNASYSGITVNEGSGVSCKELVIIGNSIRDSKLANIYVFNANRFSITGNQIVNAINTGQGQIRLQSTTDGLAWPKNGIISGNHIAQDGNNNPGIRVNSGENITVSGNSFVGNIAGIFVQSTNAAAEVSIDIIGNLFKDNVFYAIETSNTGSSAQNLMIDQNTIISTDISTKQAVGILVNGAVTFARYGKNTYSPNYITNLIEQNFGNRLTKAVVSLNSANSSQMKFWEGRNFLASTTYDPPSLAAGEGVTTTVIVPGAVPGDFVEVGFTTPLQGVQMTAWVNSASVVSVRFQNGTAATVDLASGTLTARVTKVSLT